MQVSRQRPSIPPTPAGLRKRLGLTMCNLIGAQFMYVALALLLLQRGFRNPGGAPPQVPFTTVAVVIGTLSVMLSFPVAARRRRQDAAKLDYIKAAPAFQLQFFVGFALSTVSSLAGLLLFFLYADIQPLVLLATLASAGIACHYFRIKSRLEEIERARR